MLRPLPLVAALTLAAGLLAGCSGDEAEGSGDPRPDAGPTRASGPALRYVALGDSFTAAPGVPTTDTGTFCLRSDGNYPSLVAEELGAELVDVSCSGATTEHMVAPQTFGDLTHPPQLEALDEDVDLVTVGIGGNDFNLFSMMINGCLQVAADPRATGDSPCRDYARSDGDDDLVSRVDEIEPRVADVLRRIRQRAPKADIVVVGYPQLVPKSGTCPELPLAPGDYSYARAVNLALTRAQEQAAERTGAAYVDLWSASSGHDVCADEPWVNGKDMAPDALAFHPFPAGQQAAAELVLATVR